MRHLFILSFLFVSSQLFGGTLHLILQSHTLNLSMSSDMAKRASKEWRGKKEVTNKAHWIYSRYI